MINIESLFLFIGYMNWTAFDGTAMHAVIYIMLSIFTDLKFVRIIGLPYLRI